MNAIQAIRLIDTSILCEILRIPGKSSEAESKKFIAEFGRLAAKGVRFMRLNASATFSRMTMEFVTRMPVEMPRADMVATSIV